MVMRAIPIINKGVGLTLDADVLCCSTSSTNDDSNNATIKMKILFMFASLHFFLLYHISV